MLQVTVETIAGCDHQFFFAGELNDLNNILGRVPVSCCDKFGNATTKTKSFIASNISVITIVEAEPEVVSSKVEEELDYAPINIEGDNGKIITLYVEQ